MTSRRRLLHGAREIRRFCLGGYGGRKGRNADRSRIGRYRSNGQHFQVRAEGGRSVERTGARRPGWREVSSGDDGRKSHLKEGKEERRIQTIAVLGVMLILLTASSVPAAEAQATLSSDVVAKLALARAATAKYAVDLERAKADGYGIIPPIIPNTGYQFAHPKIQGFDVTKPPILVY